MSAERRAMPDYLEMGDEVAVQASSRNQARHIISGIQGIDYPKVRVESRWMKLCDCDACRDLGPQRAHGYDQYWIYCDRGDEGAFHWWVQAW